MSFEKKSLLDEKINSDANFSDKLHFALEFGDEMMEVVNTTHLPRHVDVTIRLPSTIWTWKTDTLYPPLETYEVQSGDSQYIPFMSLQKQIILELLPDRSSTVATPMYTFPIPAWEQEQFFEQDWANYVGKVTTAFISVAFIYNYAIILKNVALEKEKQLKESMKVMGLPGWLQWMTWFLISIIIYMIVIDIMLLILNNMFRYSNEFLLFIFFLLYTCSITTFAFFLGSLFLEANTATITGIIFFLITPVPYYVLHSPTSRTYSGNTILLISLIPNSGLGYGIETIFVFERTREGNLWKNLWQIRQPYDVSLAGIMGMFLIDSIIYLCLAIYIDAIYPGNYGIPKPWYFPCMFCFSRKKSSKVDVTDEEFVESENFEKPTENLPVGIKLINLSKYFGNYPAVKNINLDIYQGQITVFVGHNGAGKTTTMNMITGMLPPSRGTAIINGYDVRTHVGKVRDIMGLCLEHNVFFDKLTVKEHLYFFGKLKGLNKKEINQEIDTYLKILELEDKKKAYPKTLSGGMKRKLSIAIALCGKSKLVILDEPTSGLDPSVRRTIWNLLQNEKKERTILLSTHFMDEADILGDRVAIMSAGEVQCYGSSFFLKQKYGIDYYLILDVTSRCRPEKVTSLLQKYIPLIQIHSHVSSELCYKLPASESRKFDTMLKDLEANLGSLEARSFGISLTSLEDVYLKVGVDQRTDGVKKPNRKNRQAESKSRSRNLILDKTSTEYLTGISLIGNKFISMFLKCFLSMLRSWPLVILQILLPALLLLIAQTKLPDSTSNRIFFPPLRLSLDTYENPVILLAGTKTNYYEKYKEIVNEYKVVEIRNVPTEILKQSAISRMSVKRRYVAGATFKERHVVVWSNREIIHSAPLALSLLFNAILQEDLGLHTVTFTNHPLPLSPEISQEDYFSGRLDSFEQGVIDGVVIMIGLAVTWGFPIIRHIRERTSGFKHLLLVSGLNSSIFWTASFLCDFIVSLLTLLAIIIVLVIFPAGEFQTNDDLVRITLVLVIFFVYALPFLYVASYLFETPPAGLITMILTALAVVPLPLLIISTLTLIGGPLGHYIDPVRKCMLFFPFYGLTEAITFIIFLSFAQEKCYAGLADCDKFTLCCYEFIFYSNGFYGYYPTIIISLIMSIIFFALLIIVDSGFFHSFNIFKKRPPKNEDIDTDVQEEKDRIKKTPEDDLRQNNALILRDLTKYFGKFLAVDALCLGVEPTQCFGLLGENGAGKTTTFKMITGALKISYGDAWINGFNVKKQRRKAQKSIGYCPQFDSLLNQLTPRETIRIFALIRGIPWRNCKNVGEKLAEEMQFVMYLDKSVKKLSSGTKRKLSVSISLISEPSVVYLDEPTSAMDPGAKRMLWSLLSKLREGGKCVILSSQSMEECEALCTKVAIMVKGSFQCLGSIQRLKSRYGQGCRLIIKVKKPVDGGKIATIDNYVKKKFPGAKLLEEFQEVVTYELISGALPWSKMFGIMERKKKDLDIEEYSLGQCSLEQVFLSFVHAQK